MKSVLIAVFTFCNGVYPAFSWHAGNESRDRYSMVAEGSTKEEGCLKAFEKTRAEAERGGTYVDVLNCYDYEEVACSCEAQASKKELLCKAEADITCYYISYDP